MSAMVLGSDDVLVLRHLLALREAGVSADDGLALVASAAPAGPLQERLRTVADARSRGVVSECAVDDLVARVLEHGDAVDVVSLRALLAQLDAADHTRGEGAASAQRLVATLIGGAGAALFVNAVQVIFELRNAEVFAARPDAVWIPRVGVVVAVVVAALALRSLLASPRGPSWLPGVPALDAAARLRVMAALVLGGVRDEDAARAAHGDPDWLARATGSFSGALGPAGTAWATTLRARRGTAAAANAVADALERGPGARGLRLRDNLQAGVVVAAVVLIALSVGALYLPIFTIAGSIN
ncbi:MAG: hypothetical protein Q8O67_09020 [Deltaproteobacteria bacterium]|nr:hypothetical protein [Deltaproteobacteria bacterium]